MKGIALIIPNANFAGSPLGKITPVTDSNTIISSYLSSVGADDTHKSKLVTLWQTLDAIGVLDTLDVFPMLGTTISNRAKGFKPTGDEYVFDSLYLGDNAAVSSGDYGIVFSNTAPGIERSGSSYKTKDLDLEGLYTFVRTRAKTTGSTRNLCQWFGKENQSIDIEIGNCLQITGQTFVAAKTRNQSPTTTDAFTYPCNVSWANYSGDGEPGIINDGQAMTLRNYNYTDLHVVVDNYFGGMSGQTAWYEGTIEMFAVGNVPADKIAQVHAAFMAYCS